MRASEQAVERAVWICLSVLCVLPKTCSAASSSDRTNDAQKGILKTLASGHEHYESQHQQNLHQQGQHQQPIKTPANEPPFSSHEDFEDTIFSMRGALRSLPQGFFTRLKSPSRSTRSAQSSGCPVALDGLPLFRCPSPRSHHTPGHRHNIVCIDDTALCDGRRDCPGHEDEDKAMCLFYRVINKHLDILFMAMRRQ